FYINYFPTIYSKICDWLLISIMKALQEKLAISALNLVGNKKEVNHSEFNLLIQITELIICKDIIISGEFSTDIECTGNIAAIVLNQPSLLNVRDIQKLTIYRPKEIVDYCNYHLGSNSNSGLSLSNICRFLEHGGLYRLKNLIKLS
ncbi:hypothetical protein MHK_004889, partial [Candidatus Magnetomorum sp. HK-1]